jgi:hypothetical protein
MRRIERNTSKRRHTLAARSRANYVSNLDGDRSKTTLVVSLEFALIEYLNLDLRGISDSTKEE